MMSSFVSEVKKKETTKSPIAHASEKRYSAWKLIQDPVIAGTETKIFRVDGIKLIDPKGVKHIPPILNTDPRTKVWHKDNVFEAEVPRFVIDECYVGIPPAVEITLCNLNDNVDQAFLLKIIEKFGAIDEITIYSHPTTKKHLGIARVVFDKVSSAKNCVNHLNGKSVMGKILTVFLDSFGAKLKEIYEEKVRLSEPKCDSYRNSFNDKGQTDVDENGFSLNSDNDTRVDKSPDTPGSAKSDFKSKVKNGIIVAQTPPSAIIHSDKKKCVTLHGNQYGSSPSSSHLINYINSPYTGKYISPILGATKSTSSSPAHCPYSYPKSQASPPMNRQRSILSNMKTEVDFINNHLKAEVVNENSNESPSLIHQKDYRCLPKNKLSLDSRIELLLKGKSVSSVDLLLRNLSSNMEPAPSHSDNQFSSFKSQERPFESCVESQAYASNSLSSFSSSSNLELLSPPPSPFQNKIQYLKCHKIRLENIRKLEEMKLSHHTDFNSFGLRSHNVIDSSDANIKTNNGSLSSNSDNNAMDVDIDSSNSSNVVTVGDFTTNHPPFTEHNDNRKLKESVVDLNASNPTINCSVTQSFSYYPTQAGPIMYTNGITPYNCSQPMYPYLDPSKPSTQLYQCGAGFQPSYYIPYQVYNTALYYPLVYSETTIAYPIADQNVQSLKSTMSNYILQLLTNELKVILTKDFQKKMIENTAFRSLEEWWDRKEQRHKSSNGNGGSRSPSNSRKFSYDADNLDYNPLRNFSLGFRTALPNLPSFRRKILPRSPQSSKTRLLHDRSDTSDYDEDPTPPHSPAKSEDWDSISSDGSESSSLSNQTKLSLKFESSEFSQKEQDWNQSCDEGFSPGKRTGSDSSGDSDGTKRMKLSVPDDDYGISAEPPKDQKSSSKLNCEGEAWSTGSKKLKLSKLDDEIQDADDENEELDHTYCLSAEGLRVEKNDVSEVSRQEINFVKSPLSFCEKSSHLASKETNIFSKRNPHEEQRLMEKLFTAGMDSEDLFYLRKKYQGMLLCDEQANLVNETHWVDHPISCYQSKSNCPHVSGCARTEGFYRMDSKEKSRSSQRVANTVPVSESSEITQSKSLLSLSREARNNQRRLLAAFGSETDSDLLKFNQLKFRKKHLRFSKSTIHDWGLFANEPIAADEMVIEYTGQEIRPLVADLREEKYERIGIGSSYLFRIDSDSIVDATKCGNLARFINHSCNPNCYAKIISVEGKKKIVIYSKQQINLDEEITYDYKFPIEDNKIPCLCQSVACKGTLN